MLYEIKDQGKFKILSVLELVDFYNINDFKKIFFDMLDGKYSHVAVELTKNTNQISSNIIGTLVTGHKKFSALQGKLVIMNPGESVKNILFVAGLSNFFTIVNSISELKSKE